MPLDAKKSVQILVPCTLPPMNCGNCGCLKWDVLVLPQGQKARIAKVRCARCGNTLDISNDAFVEGSGSLNVRKGRQPVHQKEIDRGHCG